MVKLGKKYNEKKQAHSRALASINNKLRGKHLRLFGQT